jgi:hypothetical protein
LTADLTRTPFRNAKKVDEFLVAISFETLGNIAGHGYRSSSDLTFQVPIFLEGGFFCQTIE